MQAGSLYYHFDSVSRSRGHMCAPLSMAWARTLTRSRSWPLRCGPTRWQCPKSATMHRRLCIGQNRIVGQVPPELAKEYYLDQRKCSEYWHELLLGVEAAGRLRSGVDVFNARMLTFGAMNWSSEWFDAERGPSADEIADQAILVVLGGLLVD